MTWFKKKLISVMLVGSLVFGMFGQVAFAAAGTEQTILNTTLASISAVLTTDEHADLSTAKTKFNTYINNSGTNGDAIWNKISDKISLYSGPKDKITRQAINALFAKLMLIQLSVGINSLSLTTEESAVLSQLAAATSVSITQSWEEEAAQFINQVQTVMQNNAAAIALSAVADSSTSGLITSVKDILKNPTLTITSNAIYKIIKGYSISATDIENLILAIRNGVGATEFDKASNAMIFAFFRVKADLIHISGTNPATYKLSIFNTDLAPLSGFITWSSSATAITVDSGHPVISGTPVNTTISATLNIPTKLSLHGKLLFSKNVTLSAVPTPTPATSTPVTPTPTTPTPTPAPIATPAPDVKEEAAKGLDRALEVLKDNANKVGDKQAGLKKAIEAVQEAIEKKSTLDVAKSITVTGDNVKAEFDAKQFKDLFKTVKEDADKLNDKLKAVDADAEKAKVTVTLDLGKQDANNAEVPISTDLVKEAKDAGIDKIAVKVNGVSLAADVDQFKVNTTLNIDKKETKEATDVTTLKVASDVYNFEFIEAGGNPVTFTKPVTIKLPIANITNINTDILTLAKIINGKLEFYGGKYNTAGKYFESSRKSFSTYVIVENKVEFNDTASVQAWAGKEIGIAAAKGIVQGRGEGVFAPNDKVTRAEFAAMIVKSFHLEDDSATSTTFADVKATDWFASVVAAAAKAGLINGRTAASFEPNVTISRAEMATISARALKTVKGYKNTSDNAAALAKFNDAASINASLTEGVALASSQGVVIGSNNNFNPNGLSTRAEAAVVIARLLDL